MGSEILIGGCRHQMDVGEVANREPDCRGGPDVTRCTIVLVSTEDLRALYRAGLEDMGLSERELQIASLRWGLADEEPRTIDDILRLMHHAAVTRIEIRALETRLLNQLRHGGGGEAGVREPRRPQPFAPGGAAIAEP